MQIADDFAQFGGFRGFILNDGTKSGPWFCKMVLEPSFFVRFSWRQASLQSEKASHWARTKTHIAAQSNFLAILSDLIPGLRCLATRGWLPKREGRERGVGW